MATKVIRSTCDVFQIYSWNGQDQLLDAHIATVRATTSEDLEYDAGQDYISDHPNVKFPIAVVSGVVTTLILQGRMDKLDVFLIERLGDYGRRISYDFINAYKRAEDLRARTQEAIAEYNRAKAQRREEA